MEHDRNDTDSKEVIGQDNSAPTDCDRREALSRLGRYTAYTAPVMLTLMTTKKAHAFSPPPPPNSPQSQRPR